MLSSYAHTDMLSSYAGRFHGTDLLPYPLLETAVIVSAHSEIDSFIPPLFQ